MLVQYMSDLHLEFSDMSVPPQIGRVLLLAGDIGLVGGTRTYVFDKFLKGCCAVFEKVIMVAGNHEYYNSSIDFVDNYLIEYEYILDNFHYGNCMVDIDDVTFIATTLWTDLTVNGWRIKKIMSDYSVIKFSNKKLTPSDTTSFFIQNKAWLIDQLRNSLNKKTVIMTHHAPLQFGNSSFAEDAYVAPVSDVIRDYNPNVWVFGHTHQQVDEIRGDTRFLSNPRGYTGTFHSEGIPFNNSAVFDI